jgi:uncharacterized membrane protein
MTLSLVPVIVFVLGLALFVFVPGEKSQKVALCLMLAGAIGFCLSPGHSLTVR